MSIIVGLIISIQIKLTLPLPQITTVLIEMNTQKMIDLFASDSNELQHKVKSTLEFLGM